MEIGLKLKTQVLDFSIIAIFGSHQTKLRNSDTDEVDSKPAGAGGPGRTWKDKECHKLRRIQTLMRLTAS